MKERCKLSAIEFTLTKLRQLKADARREFEFANNNDDDDDSILINPNGGGSFGLDLTYQDVAFDDVVATYTDEYMSEAELTMALTIILDKNMVWDIGLQMQTLRDMNRSMPLTRLTSIWYCPRGKIYGGRLRANGVTEYVLPKNKLRHKNKFSETKTFLAHVSSKALSNDLIHVGLWHFLNQMYTRYTKEAFKKKQVCNTIQLPNVLLQLFDIHLFEITR